MNQHETKPVIEDSVLQGIFGAVRSYQFGQSREPLAHIEWAVQKALPNPMKRKALAAQLIALLEGDSTSEAKDFACFQIALLDATEAVPVLTKLLECEERANLALHALESITDISAGKALRKALETTTGLVRVGVINALGRRRDSVAVSALETQLIDSDPRVSETAARALGMIRGKLAIWVLQNVLLDKIPAGIRQRVGDALLACAEDLVSQEKRQEAARIYTKLDSPSEPEPIRTAARIGLARSEKKG